MNSGKHSQISVEHYTPPMVAAIARQTMGGIDLDPYSCKVANHIIQATTHGSLMFPALRPFKGRIFINPYGGVTGGRSNMAIQWEWIEADYLSGHIQQAFFVGFQLSILRTAPGCLKYPFCIPRDRLHFWLWEDDPALKQKYLKQAMGTRWGNEDPCDTDHEQAQEAIDAFIRKRLDDGKGIETPDGYLVESTSPSHDNALIYLPPGQGAERMAAIARFQELAQPLGEVVIPMAALSSLAG